MAAPEFDLVARKVELPTGDLTLLQPEEGAEIPDEGPIEWAPVSPYWSILWRSGVQLARALSSEPLEDRRVIELGCGLAVPSLAAARAGAVVMATDARPEALELAQRNARANGVRIETAVLEWSEPDELISSTPFDLAIAADILYERQSVAALLSLLPRLAPEALIADPGRPASHPFVEQASRRWDLETTRSGEVSLYRLRFGAE
jgi:predicted nicotinamide N-methyase